MWCTESTQPSLAKEWQKKAERRRDPSQTTPPAIALSPGGARQMDTEHPDGGVFLLTVVDLWLSQ